MILVAALLVLFVRHVAQVAATGPVPVKSSGLAGINGLEFYDPYCGHACFRSFSPFTLSCSEDISAGGHTTADDVAHALAVCRASDMPFLGSIAWCIHQHCPRGVRASRIEKFWETEITGDVEVLPAWSYGETLAKMTDDPPTMVMTGEGLLNMTALTTPKVFTETEQTLIYYFRETALESYYGVAICVTLFAVPVLLSWLDYLPFTIIQRLLAFIRPRLWRSIIGTYHDRPLPASLGNAPNVGQALFVAFMAALNIVFLASGYRTLYPDRVMQWYTSQHQELMFYVCLRSGALAFCLMPVLFLFSARTNVLLWLTSWPHSTFLLLHRWLARLFLIQALLHSVLALALWVETGQYEATLPMPFWVWGCVATVAAVAIVLTSLLIVRRRAYDLFLATHIVLAVVCIVGCWYHIEFEYDFTFGYDTWLYATIAVWFADRLIRFLLLLRSGVRYASVTAVTTDIVRVDIPRVRWSWRPGTRAHLFFPTLKPLRFWENHPFSVVPTAMLGSPIKTTVEAHDDKASRGPCDSAGAHEVGSPSPQMTGLTVFVRKATGMTSYLEPSPRLLTLVEGPHSSIPTREVLRSDRLLLIGGGIGITGLLGFLYPRAHPHVRLCWSLREIDQLLLDELGLVVDAITETHVLVGQRLELEGLLRDEADARWSSVGVVVCGPAAMCDAARAAVARVAVDTAATCTFHLEVDSFSW